MPLPMKKPPDSSKVDAHTILLIHKLCERQGDVGEGSQPDRCYKVVPNDNYCAFAVSLPASTIITAFRFNFNIFLALL